MHPRHSLRRAAYFLLAVVACGSLMTGFVLLVQAAPASTQPVDDETPHVLFPILYRSEVSPTVTPDPTPQPGGCSGDPGDNPVLEWDAELDDLGAVHLITATVSEGDLFWRLICAQWYYNDETAPGPDHHIMVDTLDGLGARMLGVTVTVTLFGIPEEEPRFSEDKDARYALDIPMVHTLGTYTVYPDTGLHADVVEGMGTGLFPGSGIHTSFLLIWQLTRAAPPESTLTPTATATITATPTFSVTPTPTDTPIITQTTTTTPTLSATATISPSPTITSTPTITASPTITVSPTITSTPTLTASPTLTSSPTITASPTVTDTPDVSTTHATDARRLTFLTAVERRPSTRDRPAWLPTAEYMREPILYLTVPRAACNI